MEQLENKGRKAESAQTPQDGRGRGRARGVASTFDRLELKNFFVNYLTSMLLIEALIFFFCFINHLATESSQFPWKAYLFASFTTPIAITFVFGVIILTFNRYFFPDTIDPPRDGHFYRGLSFTRGDRLASFFQVVHRLPFLLSLLLLIAASTLAYKLDDIALFAAQAGAVTAQYLFFTLIGVMLVVSIGLGLWMLLSYRLRQNSLTSSHQYKMRLMEDFGMVLLEDGTMLNKDGEVVYRQDGVTFAEAAGLSEPVELLETDQR